MSPLIAGFVATLIAPDEVVVLLDGAGFPPPSCASCTFMMIDAPFTPEREPRVVILVGHSTFDSYLGLAPGDLAGLLGALARKPELLVLDTCVGAQAELLDTLAHAGLAPRHTVAVPATVPRLGLDFGDVLASSFEVTTLLARLALDPRNEVTVIPDEALAVLAPTIAKTRLAVAACDLEGELAMVMPNLVTAKVPGVAGDLLVHVPPIFWSTPCHGP